MKSNLLLMFSMVLGMAAGCQGSDANQSEVSSLDNFAGGNTKNHCGPNSTENRALHEQALKENLVVTKAPNFELQSALAASVAAVPLPLRVILADVNFQAEFVADNALVDQYCANSFSSAGEKKWFEGLNGQVDSCFVKLSGKPLQLVFKEDVSVIRHQMVRVSAYVYTHLIQTQLMSAATGDDSLINDLMTASAQYRALGDAFLEDLYNANNLTAYENIKTLRDTDSEAFENYMFAETIDSYHCSASTKRTFQSMFPKTYQVFTTGNANLRNETGLAWHEL